MLGILRVSGGRNSAAFHSPVDGTTSPLCRPPLWAVGFVHGPLGFPQAVCPNIGNYRYYYRFVLRSTRKFSYEVPVNFPTKYP